MTDKKKAAQAASTGTASKNTPNHSTGLHRQARKLLDLLRSGPQSTCELIEQHGIIRPGARAYDLRLAGYTVLTERTVERDEKGRPHRQIARYHLATGGAA